MSVDLALLGAAVIYYALEYILLKTHFYPVDIVFAGYGLYRLIYGLTRDKKNYITKRWPILINAAIIFIPLVYFFRLLILRAGFNYTPIQIGVVLFVVFLIMVASNPRLYLSDRKVVLEDHRAKMEDVDLEPYSLYLTEDVFIPGHQRFRHLEIIGLTGAGKTRYGIYPAVLQDIYNGAGVFIYDIKSDMLPDIRNFVAYSNRDYDLSVFTMGNPGGESYNPLANGTATEIAGRVFTALFPPDQDNNSHYLAIGKEFIDASVALLKYKYSTITFKDLYLMYLNPHTIFKEICLELEHKLEAKAMLNALSSEKLEDNISGLRVRIGAYVLPPWAKQINTTDPDIRMDKLLINNKILLFQASSGLFQSDYKPISILALKDLQTEIARRYEKPPKKPFFIYLDEFYNVIYPDFGEMINKARSARVGIILAHQSVGDLERCGDELRNIIVDNTVHKMIFKVGTAETADFYAKLLGTILVKNQVESHKDDGKVAGFTDKLEREFITDPDTFKNLKTDSDKDTAEAVLIIETNKGRVAGKYTLKSIQADFTGQSLLPKPERKSNGKDTNLEGYMHLIGQKGAKFFTTGSAVKDAPAGQDKTAPPAAGKQPPPHTFKKRKGTLSAFDLIKGQEPKEPGNMAGPVRKRKRK